MIAEEINEKALELLSKQNWVSAQKLFFENARKNPSHQTYNNLGFFLVSEGLTCKNGTSTNAHKLGLKYLTKAATIKESQVNLCAIATAIDYELRTASKKNKSKLYKQMYECLDKAIKINYSDEIQYNQLRVSRLLNLIDESTLKKTRELTKKFICNESISLYFQLLCMFSLQNEALECIDKYTEFIDAIDLLIFYTSSNMYEKGYELCEAIFQSFYIDKFIASAIIECCINTNHFDKAVEYAEKIKNINSNDVSDKKANWIEKVFKDIECSTLYRRNTIKKYQFGTPFITPCCYFGCIKHGTLW